jgi:CYTH domain-containing protein
LEIERKFLVADMPPVLGQYPRYEIEQAYLSFDPEVRIRRKDDTYYLTEKGEGSLVREEHEREIQKPEFDAKMREIQSAVIEKTRYVIPLGGGLDAELDVYHGRLDGLAVVEVEFPTEEAAGAFVKPDWFGREVTYDSGFRNKNLAKIKNG